jgi:hypothetical protein
MRKKEKKNPLQALFLPATAMEDGVFFSKENLTLCRTAM